MRLDPGMKGGWTWGAERRSQVQGAGEERWGFIWIGGECRPSQTLESLPLPAQHVAPCGPTALSRVESATDAATCLDELAPHEHAVLNADNDAARHDEQQRRHGQAGLLVALEHELHRFKRGQGGWVGWASQAGRRQWLHRTGRAAAITCVMPSSMLF